VLDELNFVVCAGFLPARKVTAFLDARPPGLAVVLTGRGTCREIVRRADYVTEMQNRKHPFDAGRAAIRGIDY
jgi:cob(I)alamin adenosyltransferase